MTKRRWYLAVRVAECRGCRFQMDSYSEAKDLRVCPECGYPRDPGPTRTEASRAAIRQGDR